MGNNSRGEGRGRKDQRGRGDQRRDNMPLSVEDFDPGPAIVQQRENGELCAECRAEPLHTWQVGPYESRGKQVVETRFFYRGNPQDNVRLGVNCAVAVTDEIVVKTIHDLSRNMGSTISVLTGNELAGYAYTVFGDNSAAVAEQVEHGSDIVDVLTTLMRQQADEQNVQADESQRPRRRIEIPSDEEQVREAVSLALELKEVKLLEVTDLIGERLVEIESKYPDGRFDIVISSARKMKADVTLKLAGILIADALQAVGPFRSNTDGAELLKRLNTLERERSEMANSTRKREREERGDFDVFNDARILYQQAQQLGEAQERRDALEQTYRGRFSAGFRRPQLSEESSSANGSTLGDNVGDDTRQKLEDMATQNDGDGQDEDGATRVPDGLNNNTDAPADDQQPDETDTPANNEQPADVEQHA